MYRITVLWLAAALVLTACGAGDDTATTTTIAPSTTAVPTTIAVPTTPGPATTTTPPTTVPPTTTTTTTLAPTTATAPPETTPDDELPGEPFDIVPPNGTLLGVFGVAHDDVLNVRALPGVDQPIVVELDPVARDVVSLGRGRALPESIWWEIEADGTVGWASARFLTHVGETIDDTSFAIGLIGAIPEAETMEALGQLIADAFVPRDEPELSTVVMSVAPTVGDLGEVTYDVAGLGDDSVWGFRLHVFGAPAESGDGFVLSLLESTVMCLRGVTEDGFCV